jgi:hypothetical protein
MAFTQIDSASLDVGDPLKKELFDLIRSNEIDLNSRLNSVESTAKKIDIFKFLLLNGSSFPTATGIAYYRAEDDFTITKGAIQIFEKGTLTGSVEVDIKKSTTDLDGVSFSSVFTTKPKIDFATASDYEESSNQVLNSSQAIISAGEYLRLDITITPTSTGVIPKLLINCYGE